MPRGTRWASAILLLSVAAPALAADAAAPAGWFSLAPAAVAIGCAMWLRSVIPALFLGVWLGAWGIAGLDVAGLWIGLLDAFRVHVLAAVADPDHAAVILFSIMIGGMVGMVAKNGGADGIGRALAGWATSRRRGQLATAALGFVVFVDDYANTLVVGTTMRPVTDRLAISRAKLAYLVDSTAAPVSAIAVVTTWIGYQVGLIDDALKAGAIQDVSAYGVFLDSIAYSFYPLLAIALVLWVSWTGRDFGPMAVAEQHARLQRPPPVDPAVETPGAVPRRVANAIVPLAVLVGGVLASLYFSGSGETLREIIGSADPYRSLMVGSLLGVLSAALLPLAQRACSLSVMVDAWLDGAKSMVLAVTILVLAWSLSGVSEKLGTATFLVTLLGGQFPYWLLPASVFIIAGLTSFATGTSWGTMGILIPLVIPLVATLGGEAGMAGPLLASTVAAVLAGAVFGDHCSPISDTTILSSMASGCDHVEHVRTQIPYAVLVAVVSLLFGYLPVGLGVPVWLALPVCMAATLAAAHWLSRRTPAPA